MLTERTLWRALTCALESRQARQRHSLLGRIDWIDETIDELGQQLAVSRERQPPPAGFLDLKHDELLTAREVSVMLGWNIRRVQRNAEKLGGVKPGRQFVFRAAAVREHLEGAA
jgi:hypothetical protein